MPSLLLDANTGDKLEWMHIECGLHHTVGLSKNGEVFTWGIYNEGQLGHGDRKERRGPTKVEALDGSVIIKVSCCTYYTAAITDNGEMLTWYVRTIMMILDLSRYQKF